MLLYRFIIHCYIEKRNTDITERNRNLALDNVMVKAGFKDDDFNDIRTMRNTMYGEIKDDNYYRAFKLVD